MPLGVFGIYICAIEPERHRVLETQAPERLKVTTVLENQKYYKTEVTITKPFSRHLSNILVNQVSLLVEGL